MNKTKEWVESLTYEDLNERASKGHVKQCCQQNYEGDRRDNAIFMKMRDVVLPRLDEEGAPVEDASPQ